MGLLSSWIVHVTGASGRASGYGAPATPPVPNLFEALPGEFVELPPTLVSAPEPQAARTAASVGSAMPAAPARRSRSRLLMPLGTGIGSSSMWRAMPVPSLGSALTPRACAHDFLHRRPTLVQPDAMDACAAIGCGGPGASWAVSVYGGGVGL